MTQTPTDSEFSMTADELVAAFDTLPRPLGFRSLGVGYIARRVTSVARVCNCQASARSIDAVTREPLHYNVVVIKCGPEFVAQLFPTSRVALTTSI
jgi:hypothetical protein